jgi:hypothetical protein
MEDGRNEKNLSRCSTIPSAKEVTVELSIVTLFIIFAAVIGSTSLVGALAYFLYRIRRLESRNAGGPGSGHLVEQVNRIREELLTVQEEMSSLTERLDFTEKLLMPGEDGDESADSE